MKRFHVNVAVTDFERSREFYSSLFDIEPAVLKDDYAKWMLEDPRLNFSITRSRSKRGIQHLGLQADTMEELGEIQRRLTRAGESTFEQPETECCYARSSKTWVQDPDGVAWESFVTHGPITHYGADAVTAPNPVSEPSARRCCA